MQKSHGLFIPHHQHLAVDLETLFRYLHLVIFGYRECIQCGTERATIQAVQQHMIGKGHGVAGAAAGCAIGHHEANKKEKKAAQENNSGNGKSDADKSEQNSR